MSLGSTNADIEKFYEYPIRIGGKFRLNILEDNTSLYIRNKQKISSTKKKYINRNS